MLAIYPINLVGYYHNRLPFDLDKAAAEFRLLFQLIIIFCRWPITVDSLFLPDYISLE